ncbi:iron uptake protein [Oleisolibacter albus]|uniref:iron uptake protein n=1 Tax=Oleisolibacter albus TaxID=2171757 RepID=UPI000DF434CD|nr:iron uptake protein [Oleisolibacter albus]
MRITGHHPLWHPLWHPVLRIAAAVLGGYAFTWGFIAFGMASLFALGMPFHDAEHLTAIIGVAVYLALLLWAFAARSLVRVWIVAAGGAGLMAGAASLIQNHLT